MRLITAGEVPEILRHHDVQQLGIGEAGVARHVTGTDGYPLPVRGHPPAQ